MAQIRSPNDKFNVGYTITHISGVVFTSVVRNLYFVQTFNL